MESKFTARAQLPRPADLFIPGHLGGWLALFRPARKPQALAVDLWVDIQRGETLLLSLATHRYFAAPRIPGTVAADHPGPTPDRRDRSSLGWKTVLR